MVICLERSADLHMVQLMPLPLTVSCFCKIQIGFTFLVLAHPGSRRQRVVKRVCVCVYVWSRGENILLFLVQTVGRQLVEQRQYRPSRVRGSGATTTARKHVNTAELGQHFHTTDILGQFIFR